MDLLRIRALEHSFIFWSEPYLNAQRIYFKCCHWSRLYTVLELMGDVITVGVDRTAAALLCDFSRYANTSCWNVALILSVRGLFEFCFLLFRGQEEEKDKERWCQRWTWRSSTGRTTRTWNLRTTGHLPGRKVGPVPHTAWAGGIMVCEQPFLRMLYLSNDSRDYLQTWHKFSLWLEDKLIIVWRSEVKVLASSCGRCF